MRNILEYIEQSAEKYPDKLAVADRFGGLTYKELLTRAKQIGAWLHERLPEQKNRPVAVLLAKEPKSVAAFMGVVESGNFYVVIDDAMPVDRINRIFTALRPSACVTDDGHMKTASQLYAEGDGDAAGYRPEILSLAHIDLTADQAPLCAIREQTTDTDPVYALFTSGSTGVPKGAVISHSNILSYITWYTETFEIDEHTIFGSQTPFYFSMSVSDLYGTLKTGATLYIIPKEYFSFPIRLMEFLNEKKINTIYWVPSALCIIANYKMFSYAELPEMKKVLFAGEVMPTRQLNYWIRHLPDALFANLFGPTETTDICTYYVVNREFSDDEPLPMGRACGNCDVFVLDEAGKLVKPAADPATGYSAEGELYVRGSFVASGYYGSPEKTKEAFVQNPLNPNYPEPVYKTGDLVKYNKYGELVYISRKDYQIKHMGYRIELGEIEAAAGAIEGMRSYACIYDETADKLVFIYEGKKYSDAFLLGEFRKKVPCYMEPNLFVRVKSMPHNQNGKIDRKWLKAHYKEAAQPTEKKES